MWGCGKVLGKVRESVLGSGRDVGVWRSVGRGVESVLGEVWKSALGCRER